MHFRTGASRILVTTDIPELTEGGAGYWNVASFTIINYNLPSREVYLHRVGASAHRLIRRQCINLITIDEVKALQDIVNFYSLQVGPLEL